MFTLKELHGKLVPINVCYTIVDEVSYMQLFLSKDKKVKKEYEIKPYVRHTSKYDYVVIVASPKLRPWSNHLRRRPFNGSTSKSIQTDQSTTQKFFFLAMRLPKVIRVARARRRSR